MFICDFESQNKRRTYEATEWVFNSGTKLCSMELFNHTEGLPWLRRLDADLSSQKSGFKLGQSMWYL
jgi:hypothetical protein